MGIDIEAIRRKIEEAKNGGNKGDQKNDFWKPKPGKDGAKAKYRVRIIPFPDPPEGLPFQERHFYYEFKPAMLALHKMGQRDPVRELQRALYEEGTDVAKATAKKLWPRERYFAAVIVRPDENATDGYDESVGVKLWGFSGSVHDLLLEKFVDADFQDITDPMDGNDITIESWTETGFSGYKSKVEVRPRKSKMLGDITPAKVKELQAQIPDLDKIYPLPTYEEVKDALDKWSNKSVEPTSREGLDKLADQVKDALGTDRVAAQSSQRQPTSTSTKLSTDEVASKLDDEFDAIDRELEFDE